eukprot:771091-Pelagomonas_calceolata.AAC.5
MHVCSCVLACVRACKRVPEWAPTSSAWHVCASGPAALGYCPDFNGAAAFGCLDRQKWMDQAHIRRAYTRDEANTRQDPSRKGGVLIMYRPVLHSA